MSSDLFTPQPARKMSRAQRLHGHVKLAYRRATKGFFTYTASIWVFVRGAYNRFLSIGVTRLFLWLKDTARDAFERRGRALRAIAFTPDIVVAADPLALDLDKFAADFAAAFAAALQRGETTRILVSRDPAHEIELRFSPFHGTIEALCGRRKASATLPEFHCGLSRTIVHLRRENLRITLTPKGGTLASLGHLEAQWF